MIGSLRGTILEIHPTSILVEVAGVGYDVRTPLSTLSNLHTGDAIFFYIHHHVREDGQDLYGFLTRGEMMFFQKLISISGIGPKLGLTLLSGRSMEDVRDAISRGDLARLTSVPGVGKKTAQKIVLELKGQLVDETTLPSVDQDVIEALTAMGYGAAQARDAIKGMPETIESVSDRVREALRVLGRG